MEYLKKLTLKKKLFIINGILLAAVGAIIYFVVVPSLKEIKRMQADIEAQRTDLEEKYQKGQSLKKLTESLEAIEPKLERLDQVFINQNRELEFITALEDIAGKQGVDQKITLGKIQPAKNKDYQKMPITISAGGRYADLIRYLLALESSNYYINISSIEIAGGGPRQPNSVADGAAQDGQLGLAIQAETYWK